MKKGKVWRKANGITLIALVIIIVVMLILAGVTINLTIGENGIFTAAIEAREQQKIAEYKEKIELARASVALENMGEVTLDRLIAKIYEENIVPENAITKIDDEKAKMTTKEGYTFLITADSIEYVEKEETGTTEDNVVPIASIAMTPQQPTLTSQITGADYGKYIDYSVTVEGEVLDDWRVFYNDKTTGNVYIIYDGYLPNRLIPEATGMTTEGIYQAYWDATKFSTNEETVATLKNTTYWNAFAQGISGATATGSPTNKMLVDSWNANPAVNSIILTEETFESGLSDSSKLYIPYTSIQSECFGYWLASPYTGNNQEEWLVNCGGVISYGGFGTHDWNGDGWNDNYYGVRPLVCLPSGITGTVGDTVELGEVITTENPAKATVTLKDNESGVDITSSRYVYTTTASSLGTTDVSKYTNSFTTNPQTITLNATTPGTYYLHVLTVDKAGNKKETISSAVTVTVINPTLTSQITGSDYGKYIDYSVTVEGEVLDDWRVFYNDKTKGKVYIILDGYLPSELIPKGIGISTNGTYQAFWENISTHTEAVATLTNTTYWSVFAKGVTGASATGGPTNEMFVKSWNENPAVNARTLSNKTWETELVDPSKLYMPYTEIVESCWGYWLATPYDENALHLFSVNCVDFAMGYPYWGWGSSAWGIRPLVCLSSSTTGTVGTSVTIDK